MLSHTIAPHKKEPVVGYNQPFKRINTSAISTQELLDALLEKSFPVGKYVTYSVATNVHTAYMVSYIVDVEKDFNALKIDHKGYPETHLLVQLGNLAPEHCWSRWVDIRDYRELTEDEQKGFTRNDLVQNFVSKLTAEGARSTAR
jgi:hypothetical protein